eukprot:CAMPEP_0194703002 /NCGR_PEP_ID=MMETSP0295-20121207/27279_1 /TAXON_ID=39354 /ORGANISM="Heterosigma akashiwo, Strain CCMP2393" /LENGTH=125 /DNA_ID=CAMNT_0039597815 /DNA_START=161 /DNA_END=535 /DNA_ORIENTATION=-
MEDRTVIEKNIPGLPHHIIDGHGGDEVSAFCEAHVVRVFAEQLARQRRRTGHYPPGPDDLAEALGETFFALDEELKHTLFQRDGAILRTQKPDSLDVWNDGTEDKSSDLITKIELFEEVMAGTLT